MNIHSKQTSRVNKSSEPPIKGSGLHTARPTPTIKAQLKGCHEIEVPDIKDFNTFEELSNRVMDDVDIIKEIIDKYDRRNTDHIMALAFYFYKERIVEEGWNHQKDR